MSQQVYLPSYSIGEDVYKRVPQICSNYGKTAIVIGGEISLSKVKDKLLTKCERKAPKFIYGDISSLKNNDSISLFFIVLYF